MLFKRYFGRKEETIEKSIFLREGPYAGTKIERLSKLDLNGNKVLYGFYFVYKGKGVRGSVIGGKDLEGSFLVSQD